MFKAIIKNAILLPCLAATAHAQNLTLEKTHGPWISSRPYLQEKTPEFPVFTMGLLTETKRIIVDSLNNIEQARAVAALHTTVGTRSHNFGEGFLTVSRDDLRFTADATKGTRWTILRNMRTYAGKEVRLDVVPDVIKNGVKFDFTKAKKAPTGPAPVPVRYGLILRDIEPSEERYAVAALGSDMDYVQQAPQAELIYDVGPLTPTDGHVKAYAVSLAEPVAEKRHWKSYLPDYHFRGKVTSKGRPTLAQPIPKQALTLEQAEGLYSTEIVFVNGLKKESIAHRLYLPVYKSFRIAEEYDEQFRPRKVIFSDIVSQDGFSLNVEHHLLEERYQTGLHYRSPLMNLDLYAHVPHAALKNDDFWAKHRWEMAFTKAF